MNVDIDMQAIYLPDSTEWLQYDAISLLPRAKYRVKITIQEKRSSYPMEIHISVPYRKMGYIETNHTLYSTSGQQAPNNRTRIYGIGNLCSGKTAEFDYCSRDGIMGIEIQFYKVLNIPPPVPHWLNSTLNFPIIHFKRLETTPQSVTYSCRIEGIEHQLIFSVEYILKQENLLIREMKLH